MKIKNIVIAILSALFSFCALVASAAIDNVQYSGSIPATTATTLGPYVLRGELHALQIIAPVGSTGTVAVSCGGVTIFSKAAITAGTNTYYPRIQAQSSDGSVTNSTTVLERFPCWGPVSVTVTKTDLATNTWSVQAIYNR